MLSNFQGNIIQNDFSSFIPLLTALVTFLILQLLSFTEFRSFHDFSLKGWNHQADSQDQGTEDSNIAGIDAKRNHGPNQNW